MNKDDLGLKLNPTVFTSRACLMGGASNGDPESERLLEILTSSHDFEEKNLNFDKNSKDDLYRFSMAYGTMTWVRNVITEKKFEKLHMTAFLDLGCGVTSRGLNLCKRRLIRYYGVDLPPVIEEMSKLTNIISRKDGALRGLFYFPVDITDYAALRSVIHSKEPLFIATDGLMMYLTESEMTTLVDNISKLLAEFGGVWVTGDAFERSWYEAIMLNMFGSRESSVRKALRSVFSDDWRKLIFDNSFFRLDENALAEFLKKHGLSCKKIRVDNELNNLCSKRMRDAFESTGFMMMSSTRYGEVDINAKKKTGTTIVSSVNENVVSLIVNGRLDTISAPSLVSEYESCLPPDKKAMAVDIDMGGCTYISSAGIRALLMLYKRTMSIDNGFSMRNIVPEVREILDITSFSDLF